ncbi:restriction endonuclease subunit S [Pseudomonas aeruginosa]|uniref:restriction endonuclease subunit S n=1 Tax=Pseudomonas aeruginosa TaxID=287 RepID=UPI001386E929|nr:restriction endonuclease subunit S [Pseudomonas aeruginosa]MBO2861791.1 restriction endonuclease subunit S [Pseudomonas aeruginosa]MBO2940853.1 restriction endonuclease subunit S [Pseudomonas aeruginosa]MBX6864272.1 restriction endonuclease subunit S [Pseudomonas aeruginosa]MCZ9752721.1 restriction endonuclease subunit S [Pseudomonas aeruginosa]WCV85345.1 restriction endonuclease subunit S [Pseudomonas aeruginosa]
MSWPISKLGAVISFIRGVTFTPEDQVEPFSDGSTVVMRTKNVQVAGLDQGDLIAVPSGFVRRKEQSLREGDILVSSANSWELVGKASYVPKLAYEATAGGFISIVRAKETLIDSRYLYHWVACPSTQHKIRHCGRQTTNISNLDVGRFQDLDIPLPPLPEQKRIAAILDKADAIRRKRQQAIQLADDFLRAVFLDMFGDPVTNPMGWDVVELSTLVDPRDKLNYGVVQPGENEEDGVPLVRSGDLSDVTPDVKKLRRVSASIDSKHRKSKLKGNEILIACVGTIGRVGWVSDAMIGWNIARAVTRIPIREGVNREYVYRYLQSPVVQGYFERETRAVAQPTLNVGLIAKTPVALPPHDMQIAFLERYGSIQTHKERLLNALDAQERLSGSLSQRAFSGKL